MAGTSAKTSSTVEIVNITPRRRLSVGEKIRLIEAGCPRSVGFSCGTNVWRCSKFALPLEKADE